MATNTFTDTVSPFNINLSRGKPFFRQFQFPDDYPIPTAITGKTYNVAGGKQLSDAMQIQHTLSGEVWTVTLDETDLFPISGWHEVYFDDKLVFEGRISADFRTALVSQSDTSLLIATDPETQALTLPGTSDPLSIIFRNEAEAARDVATSAAETATQQAQVIRDELTNAVAEDRAVVEQISSNFSGWAPVFSVVADGQRRVQQVTDWTGGYGAKPTTGQYVGAAGLVSNIAQAIDIRGPQGVQGEQGIQGIQGIQGQQGVKGDTGDKWVNWRGAWVANTPYVVEDGVTNGTNSWRCKTAHTSGSVFDPSNWDPISIGSSTPTPRSLSALTDAPNYLGEVALYSGRNYRAMSASPVAWLPSVSGGFPLTDGSTGAVSATRLTVAQFRDFFVDIQISGTNPALTYAFTEIYRGGASWLIRLYSYSGTPGTATIVAQLNTAINPENGNNITVHTLSTMNSSGVTGRVAVNWSKIPVRQNFNMAGWSETDSSAGYVLHQDVYNTTHWGYFAALDLATAVSNAATAANNVSTALSTAQTANTNASAAIAPPKSLTALTDVPDRVGQLAILSGKQYRSVSVSPVAWLPIASYGFPFTDGSTGAISTTRLTIAQFRDFLIDLQLIGTNPAYTYAIPIIYRNSGTWTIYVYSYSGTPGTATEVARFQTATSPENGNNITVHTLSTMNSSGVSGKIAVNWSKIPLPSAQYFNMAGWSETDSSAGYMLHPDVYNTTHWGYFAQQDFAAAKSTTADVTTAKGGRATLTDRLSVAISTRGLPTTTIWGREKLLLWPAWKRNQNSTFDIGFFGDSFTAMNRYTLSTRDYVFSDGYTGAGGGWCSFARPGEAVSAINGAIKSGELSVSYDYTQWTNVRTASQLGIDGHVVSTTAGNQIVVTSGITHSTMTLLFERHSGGAGFRYKLNSGAWVNVSTDNATQDVSNVVIDVSALTAGFTLTIEAQEAGVILFGCIGRKTGNGLLFHKCGMSGSQATYMDGNPFWATNVAQLNLKLAIIMWGTNEQGGNIDPAVMGTAYQSLINKLRVQNPLMDIIICIPQYTRFETIEVHTYSNRDYARIAYDIAQANQCALIDFGQAFGSFRQALVDQGFFDSDQIHPSPMGGTVMGDIIYSILKK